MNGEKNTALKILITDDNTSVRDSLADILSDEGFEVSQAKSFSEGIAQANENNFDIALIDLKLPDGDGAELGQELVKINPGISVIIITGYVDTAENEHKKSDFIYIFKPIDIPYLLKTLKNIRGKSEEGS